MHYHFKKIKNITKNMLIFIKKDEKRYKIKIMIYYIDNSQIFTILKSFLKVTNYYALMIQIENLKKLKKKFD